MRVNDLKFMIELAIGKDRGYATESLTAEWASAAAEEIEKMINGAQSIENIRADDIGAQLAKLFANTICTSAQYNINLSRFYQSAKLDVDLAANFSEEYHLELAKDIPHPEVASLIRHYTRDLVSTLARYHGWNHESDPTPLGESISHIHALIFHLAKEFQLDLLDHLNRVVHRARMNSESLHVETYHPTTAQNLEYFAPIKENTVCIFSRSAFTWGARLFDSGKSLQANLHSNIGTFSRFCRATAHEDIDAFLFMFPGHYGTCLDQLSNFAKTCLLFFSDHDPKEEHCLKQISSQNWRFRFNGMPMFVQWFAPCYSVQNTRYAMGRNQVFLQFVSESAFHRAVKREARSWQHSRDKIRTRAKEIGQPYDVHEREALTFVHPLRGGEDPVRWFDAPGLDPNSLPNEPGRIANEK